MTGIYDTTDGQCDKHMMIRGEDFQCSLASDHNGWAHQSTEAETIWQ